MPKLGQAMRSAPLGVCLAAAYITHPICARHEMGRPSSWRCPERLGAIQDMLLTKGLLDYMHSYDAPAATVEQSCARTRRCMCRKCWQQHRRRATTAWTPTRR